MPTQLTTLPLAPSFFAPRDDTVLTWLSMAGVAINSRGTVILIDPLLVSTERDGHHYAETGHRLLVSLPIQASQVPRVDAVLYTHADADHLGLPTARDLEDRLHPRFIATPPSFATMARAGLTRSRQTIARDFATIAVGDIRIEITPALHDWQEENPSQRGDCCGYVVRTPDGAIWHPGDTRLIDELLEVRDVDVLFFDVAHGAKAHLGPDGSARLARTSGAKDLIAYHYGTFAAEPGAWASSDPADSLPFVAGLSARFLQPNPGELYRLPQQSFVPSA